MTRSRAKLMFLWGKMAAGKSTFARELARRHDAVLLVKDELLSTRLPGEITDIPGFVKYSSRLIDALGPHIGALLSMGIDAYFQPPTVEEGFNVVHHVRD